MATSILEEDTPNRKRAAFAVIPVLVLGVANVGLILGMGLRPLWGFVLLPPVLFLSVLAWIAFSNDFLADRT